MNWTLAPLLLSAALFACEGLEDDADSSADDVGNEDEPALGDTPLPACEAAMFGLAQIEAELRLPDPDLDYVIELYRGSAPDLSGESPLPGGTAVQRWVREVGARLGRVEAGVLTDDLAIEQALELAALEQGQARKLILADVLATLRAVALLDVRARLAMVSDALPDPQRDPALFHAEWDWAWCVWSGSFATLASSADAVAGEDWEATIEGAFTTGSAGIIGPEQAWAPDELATKSAKQVVEKGSFGVVQRNLLALAERARAKDDPLAAREARGLLALIEDRILGRNTPALELITTMLEGAPAEINADLIEHELAIVFVKRARKYCDEALLAGSLGSAEAAKGVDEGIMYTRIVLPVMTDLLSDTGFEPSAHMQTWADYRDAVLNDDAPLASSASEDLCARNCELQAALEIAACTDSADE
ncbi:hypothetical protein [Enhygromyxa salina]|nr:hypothetical protein [Enhygromyxa salina]